MAAAAPDLPQLSSYLGLPEPSLQTLLTDPTVDLVTALLEKIASRAREHQKVVSENDKLSIELENAVRVGETKARALKASVDKGLKEAAELRQQLQAGGEVDCTGKI
jgi:nucleoprotein TPR